MGRLIVVRLKLKLKYIENKIIVVSLELMQN